MGFLSAETQGISGGSAAFTVPAGCTFLLVKLAHSTGSVPTSVTLGGSAAATVVTTNNGDSLASGVYSRTSPAMGSLTLAHNSTATYSQATLEYYDGIDLVTPVRDSAQAGGNYTNSFTLGVTSVAGDLCSDFIVIQEPGTATAGGSQTLIISNTFGTPERMYAASRQTASGITTTFAWTTSGTGQRQAHLAVSLRVATVPLGAVAAVVRYAAGGIIANSTNVALIVPLPAQTTSGTAGLKIAYTRSGAAPATATAVAGTATGAHLDWSIVPCDPTNIPELHRIDLPDAAFAVGADLVTLTVSATGMAATHYSYPLRLPATVFGTVAAGTLTVTSFSTSLTNTTNQLARRILEFTSGPNVGQRVAIVGNDGAGVLQVAPPLLTTPTASNWFVIL